MGGVPGTGGGGPSGSSAAFARQRLLAARAAGILPQNFNVARTRQNVLGQFHMLMPGIVHAQHNPNDAEGNQTSIQSLIAQLGSHNMMLPNGRGPNWNNAAPAGMPTANGMNVGAPNAPMNLGAVDPQQLIAMIYGGMFGPQAQAGNQYTPANPLQY